MAKAFERFSVYKFIGLYDPWSLFPDYTKTMKGFSKTLAEIVSCKPTVKLKDS